MNEELTFLINVKFACYYHDSEKPYERMHTRVCKRSFIHLEHIT